MEGLGILKGEILRIPDCPGLKIPHMGWNSLKLQNDGRLFKDLPEEPYVYFVHSYYLKATDESTARIFMLRLNREMYLPASSIRKRAVIQDFRY